jgi:hypothetical protein
MIIFTILLILFFLGLNSSVIGSDYSKEEDYKTINETDDLILYEEYTLLAIPQKELNSSTNENKNINGLVNETDDLILYEEYTLLAIPQKGLILPINKIVLEKNKEPRYSNLEETGKYGNIALVGTNGLKKSSYSSSTYLDNEYTVNNLFDGFEKNKRINIRSNGRIGKGYFSTKRQATKNQWVAVDFGKNVSISGFRVVGSFHEGSNNPKNIIIQSSLDGINYTDNESFTLVKVFDSGFIKLIKSLKTQYFRFYIKDSYSGIELNFSELEIFQ